MNEDNRNWLSQRDQSAAAHQDAARDLAAMHKGLKENGLSPLESAEIVGSYFGHVIFLNAKDAQREGDE